MPCDSAQMCNVIISTGGRFPVGMEDEQRLARNRQPERLEHQDECDRGDAVLLKERCQVAECMLYCRHPGIYSRRNEDIVKAPPQRSGLARTPTLSIGSDRVVVAQKLVADKRTRIGTDHSPARDGSRGGCLGIDVAENCGESGFSSVG